MNKIIFLAGMIVLFTALLVGKEVFEIGQLGLKEKIDELFTQECNLQNEPCRLKFENEELVLSFKNSPVYLNEKNQIYLLGSIPEGTKVYADFVGVEMEMGYNRPEFKPANNDYQADIILPTCARKTMSWNITIIFHKDDKITGFRYTMVTGKK